MNKFSLQNCLKKPHISKCKNT